MSHFNVWLERFFVVFGFWGFFLAGLVVEGFFWFGLVWFFVVFSRLLHGNTDKPSHLLNWNSQILYKAIYPTINNEKLNSEMK